MTEQQGGRVTIEPRPRPEPGDQPVVIGVDRRGEGRHGSAEAMAFRRRFGWLCRDTKTQKPHRAAQATRWAEKVRRRTILPAPPVAASIVIRDVPAEDDVPPPGRDAFLLGDLHHAGAAPSSSLARFSFVSSRSSSKTNSSR